jgi:formylglycine-generating enzyme required for sulfatase activity
VTSVSFNEALEFCRLLTEKEHALSESSKGKYSLPSESQWEYAARGGSTSFSPGDGVWSSSNSGGKPGAVMRFAPNRFGLYDMSGSVWEWTLDYWHPNYEGAPVDGASWDYDGDIDYRVLRGGSWDFPQRNCRYSVRIFEVPYKKRKDVGIRVIFNPSD